MKILVIDIGGTFIKYAIMDDEAKIYHKGKVCTPHESLDVFIQTIVGLYEENKAEIAGIALSMPGNIDSDTGHIYTPGALSYNADVNIIEELHKYIDLPISVENDGKSAALAEMWKGHLVDCDDGVVLVLGSGIGGGIIHNREIVKGKHFFAGEVSFLMSDLANPDMSSMLAMRASTLSLVHTVAKRKDLNPQDVSGEQVFKWIQEGDNDACEAFEEMTTLLASQIFNLQCLLDPEKILIGGGVSKQKVLLETIQEKIDQFYSHIPFPAPKPCVDTCKYHNDSNLIGALYNYKKHFD